MIPRIRAYVKGCDGQTKWINFLIEDDNLLEKYKTIWNKTVLLSKKKLMPSLSIIKRFNKPKKDCKCYIFK